MYPNNVLLLAKSKKKHSNQNNLITMLMKL